MMKSSIFLAKCNDKDHSMDSIIVEDLNQISEIKNAVVTHVNFRGEEYCISISTKGLSSDKLVKLPTKIKRQQNIVDVTKFL